MSGPTVSWRFHRDLEGEAIQATCTWLRANGLNPDRVPFGARYTIDGDRLTYDHELLGPGPCTVPLLQPLPEPFASDPGGLHVIRAPWRLDPPEIPDRVTAFKDANGNVYVRDETCPEHWFAHPANHRWTPYAFRDLAHYWPLAECDDPRGIS